MKCPNCNSLNKDDAKFCKNCGKQLSNESLAYSDKFGSPENNNSNSSNLYGINKNILIIVITAIICVAIISSAFIIMNGNNHEDNTQVATIDNGQSNTNSVNNDKYYDDSKVKPISKSWHLIDSYSGSGTGSESCILPSGKIKVKISAFPIKNYATNYLSASSSSGDYVGVDWGSKSAVATKSDSMIFTSYSDVLSIDYYETVSWNVDVYKYY